MKFSAKIFFLFALILLLTSCGSTDGTDMNLFAMDTILNIHTSASLPSDASDYCRSITGDLEKKLSVTIETSETAQFNLTTESLGISDETAEIVRIALKISEITGGAFDITVCPLVKLWNIAHPGENWTPPNEAQISPLLVNVGYEKLGISYKNGTAYLSKSTPPVEIDLGGIAKGWAVGKLAEYLSGCTAENSSYGTLSFGGNVAVFGSKSKNADFLIGVTNPFDPKETIGFLSVKSGIIAVSGGYERFVELDGVRYHHIIDPSSGKPAESDLASAAVWVSDITPEAGAVSDALSTALFVMGSEKSLTLLESGKLESEFGFEIGAVLITNGGEIITTKNLSGRFVSK